MENITISEYTDPISQLVTEYVTIDKGNDEYTFMPKSVYDAQVEHLTEIPTPDEA